MSAKRITIELQRPLDPFMKTIAAAAVSSNRLLAGVLKSKNLLPDRRRKFDEHELIYVEKIVFSALINDPNEIILGSPGVR